VSRWGPDGQRIPTTLFEAAAWHLAIVAICRRCAHESVFHPHALWWLFQSKRWDDHFSSVTKRLKCTKCGAGAFMTWNRNREPTVTLPLPSQHEWKRAVAKFRS
jgi:hypothetical protein